MTDVQTQIDQEADFLDKACGGCLYHNSPAPLDYNDNGVCRARPSRPVAVCVQVPTKIVGQALDRWTVQNRQSMHANVWPACGLYRRHPDAQRVELYTDVGNKQAKQS